MRNVFKELYGKPCWNVREGYGGSLRLEFGQPHLKVTDLSGLVRKYPHMKRRRVSVCGDWHLWIYCCDWTIRDHGKVLADRSSPEEKIHLASSRLSGQMLIDVAIEPKTSRTEFTFDDGGQLETRRWKLHEPHELWLLYRPTGYVFTVRSDGRYTHTHQHTHLGAEPWHKLEK